MRQNAVSWDIADGPRDQKEGYVELERLGPEMFRSDAGDFEAQKLRMTFLDKKGEPSEEQTATLLVSREGLLLGIQWKHRGGQEFSLVRYEKYAEFGPGKQ